LIASAERAKVELTTRPPCKIGFRGAGMSHAAGSTWWAQACPCSSPARGMGNPSMGASMPSTSLSVARPEIDRARARWAHQGARRNFANLDREPGPPHAPEASPVEAQARRFGLGRGTSLF
jgi:hypothetical protein